MAQGSKNRPAEAWLPVRNITSGMIVLDNNEKVTGVKITPKNIFIMDETQIILGAGCAASTKLIESDGKITRIHNYKFPFEYINRFDELMKKKELIYKIIKPLEKN